jgi:hypothetical protein
MPRTTTVRTVKKSTKATSKLPKFGLLSRKLRQPQLPDALSRSGLIGLRESFHGTSYGNLTLPALTLAAVSN